MTEQKSNKLWGGRFTDSPDAIMEAMNASIDYDKRLWQEDIRGSKAHARMLYDQEIITQDDYDLILKGLGQISKEIVEDKFVFSAALEDIHMNIENRLCEIVGDAGGRLHTARSRNDQVATDVKLWLREQTDHVIKQLKDIQKSLLVQAEKHIHTIMPGFTHLQTAQPISFAHHLMAYYEMFERDRQRFIDARVRVNQCPLGAAALAGTVYPIDRFQTAKALGFDGPTHNSLDSVSSRDFALEFMAHAAISAGHISRFSEEIVIWMTPQFGFVSLSDKWTTGSSIMPQKKNPDAAELLRAKTGRMNGNLIALLTVMKGLPLAYSKDMQEDKEALFDTVDNYALSLSVLNGMLIDMTAHPDKMRGAAESGFSVATDLADWLVKALNLPFRRAHHITGQLVKYAEDHQMMLHEIPLDIMQSIEGNVTDDIYAVLCCEASVKARTSYGGTAFEQVTQQIEMRKAEWL